jgi:hypothetical protein
MTFEGSGALENSSPHLNLEPPGFSGFSVGFSVLPVFLPACSSSRCRDGVNHVCMQSMQAHMSRGVGRGKARSEQSPTQYSAAFGAGGSESVPLRPGTVPELPLSFGHNSSPAWDHYVNILGAPCLASYYGFWLIAHAERYGVQMHLPRPHRKIIWANSPETLRACFSMAENCVGVVSGPGRNKFQDNGSGNGMEMFFGGRKLRWVRSRAGSGQIPRQRFRK